MALEGNDTDKPLKGYFYALVFLLLKYKTYKGGS